MTRCFSFAANEAANALVSEDLLALEAALEAELFADEVNPCIRSTPPRLNSPNPSSRSNRGAATPAASPATNHIPKSPRPIALHADPHAAGAREVANQLARVVWWEKPNLFGRRITTVPALFQALDRNGDGLLSRRELACGMRQVGVQALARHLTAFLDALDPSHSDHVTLAALEAELGMALRSQPSQGKARAFEGLHNDHAEFQEKMARERAREAEAEKQRQWGHGRFATPEDMAEACERAYGKSLRARDREHKRRQQDRDEELRKLAPFRPALTTGSAPEIGTKTKPSPSVDAWKRRELWLKKQEFKKADLQRRLEQERREEAATRLRELKENSVHRTVTEETRTKRCDRLYQQAQRRRDKLALARQKHEQEKADDFEASFMHAHAAAPSTTVSDIVQRLAGQDLEGRKARAEDRLCERLKDDRLAFEQVQRSHVDREAQARKCWSKEDLAKQAARLHTGEPRKLRWQSKSPPDTRGELLAAVFGALGGTREQRLTCQQLELLASICGCFASDDCETCQREHAALCAAHGWDAMLGINDKQLIRYLDGELDTGLYCTDDMLRLILLELGHRHELLMALFRALRGRGHGQQTLGEQHVRRYADLCGFQGSDDDWSKEYAAVCADYGWSVASSVDIRQFSMLVNDMAGVGYRSDDQIHDFLVDLRYRPKLVSVLFDLLANVETRRLGVLELRCFAELCGFHGSEDSWIDEYLAMAAVYAFPPETGAGVASFLRMMNDAVGSAHRTDDELHSLILELFENLEAPGPQSWEWPDGNACVEEPCAALDAGFARHVQ